MSHKLVLATRNQGKIIEFRRILDSLAPGAIELIGVDQFPELVDVAETGSTFAENSLLKARYTSEATGLPAIADDSGLCVEALAGAPGIFSARWAGSHGNDLANLELLLDQLKDVPDEISELGNLRILEMRGILFTDEEAHRIDSLVVKSAKIYLSPSCNCKN